jgi:hypothetical protein
MNGVMWRKIERNVAQSKSECMAGARFWQRRRGGKGSKETRELSLMENIAKYQKECRSFNKNASKVRFS